ncbi:hypothetical protein HDU86_001095 [Geranomyces michiganensis]|nr:hypothetical protein HDU86_001095 [Geranomyces michiganensis]
MEERYMSSLLHQTKLVFADVGEITGLCKSLGRAVIFEEPYAAVVDDLHLSTHCSACFGANARFRCGKCGTLQYCSQACQRQDWVMHKAECAAFRKVAPRKPPTAVRALCRILWRKAADPPSYSATVETLQSHRAEQSDERLETFAQMAMLIRSLVGDEVCPGAQAIVKLLCQVTTRLSCNSISISDEELVNIGVGMFPSLALVNHSCSPNTAIIFTSGGRATLRTIKSVASDDEIFQSYTEIAEPRHVRQRELQQTFFFTCHCSTCSLGPLSDPRTAHLCPRGPRLCAGIINLPEGTDNPACSVHGPLSPDEQAALECAVKEAHATYDQAVQARDIAKNPQRALELGLRSRVQHLAIAHSPGNASLLQTDRLLLALYLEAGDFAAAYPIACEMREAFEVLYSGNHPAKAVHAYMVFKLAEWADPENRALLVQLGEAAVAAIGKSHGETSVMCKEAMEKLRPMRSSFTVKKLGCAAESAIFDSSERPDICVVHHALTLPVPGLAIKDDAVPCLDPTYSTMHTGDTIPAGPVSTSDEANSSNNNNDNPKSRSSAMGRSAAAVQSSQAFPRPRSIPGLLYTLQTESRMVLLQLVIIGVCIVVLSLGTNGTVIVSQQWRVFKPNIIGFSLGVVAQVALIAPIELSRKIAQSWFWRKIGREGMNFRTMVTTWSIIYSNSYRGAEDIFRGLSFISAFLMLVYLFEVAACGAIGSLNSFSPMTTLKASGSLPMYRLLQDPAKTADAPVPVDLASRAFLNFAKAYDPLVSEGLALSKPGDNSTTAAVRVDQTDFWTASSSVILSPLTVLNLALADEDDEPEPPAVSWTTLAQGDTVATLATDLTTSVTCGPSSAVSWQNTSLGPQVVLAYDVEINGVVEQTRSYLLMWSAGKSYVTAPQVQTVMFARGEMFDDPVVTDDGELLFALVAFGFEDYGDLAPIVIPFSDEPGERVAGIAVCRLSLAMGTVDARHQVLHVTPASVMRLLSADRVDPAVTYSMSATTDYGYGAAVFIFQTLYVITCDILPCMTENSTPPLIDSIIGLVTSTTDSNGTRSYGVNIPTMTAGITKLIAHMMVSFAGPVDNPSTSNNASTATTTTLAHVYEHTSQQRVFTTPGCNVMLVVGIVSGCAVIVMTFVSGQQQRFMGGSTESLYLLLQLLLPSQRLLPNVSDSEWRDAQLGRLKELARQVHVQGAPDESGRVRLRMGMKPAAGDSEGQQSAKSGEETSHTTQAHLTKTAHLEADEV